MAVYEACARSYQLEYKGVGMPVVHNEILLKKDGQVVATFNGDPSQGLVDRNGDINWGSMLGSGSSKLRVSESGSSFANRGYGLEMVAEGTLLMPNGDPAKTTDPAVFEEWLEKARATKNHINGQGLTYQGVGILFDEACNSNSAAYTITQALGMKYPPDVDSKIAPGCGNDLRTKDFIMANESPVKGPFIVATRDKPNQIRYVSQAPNKDLTTSIDPKSLTDLKAKAEIEKDVEVNNGPKDDPPQLAQSQGDYDRIWAITQLS
ncbi:MAG: hypothetical protein KDI46_08105 [Alphaproteobacteria bacterium]|nr:hypothetical protein [Alphaproteobacteria bacterium]